MKWILISIAVLLTSILRGQEQYITGMAIDSVTQEPLPYVNIGIEHKTIGTVSDPEGKFTLRLNENASPKDTVLFSYMGYTMVKRTVESLLHGSHTIMLSPSKTILDEVVLKSKKIKWKPRKIGRSTAGLGLTHANFYSYYEKDVDDRLGKEWGMKFNIRRTCHLLDLNFNITSNDFKSLTFRVNIYRMENDLPGEPLVHQNIIFTIPNSFTGWYKVDLEPYAIYLKENTGPVAVTIQWLQSQKAGPKSKYFSISTAASPAHTAFYREKAMDIWSKSGQNLSFYLNTMCE